MDRDGPYVGIELYLPETTSDVRYADVFGPFISAYERRAADPAAGLPIDVRFFVSDASAGWIYGHLAPAAAASEDHRPALRRFAAEWAEALTALLENRTPTFDGPENVARQLSPLAAVPGGEILIVFGEPNQPGVVHAHLSQRQAVEVCALAEALKRVH